MVIKLCAFADEAATNFEEQIEILKEEKIPFIKLRGLDGKNVPDLTEDEAKHYKKILDEENIKVWSIGLPLGKIKISDDFETHLKKAEHLFRIAKIFGTNKIRMFSFYCDDVDKDEKEVILRLKRMIELANKYEIELYHENEKGIYGDIANRCDKLLNKVSNLKCVFDPANFVQCNEYVSSALKLLKDRVGYYHIKDALYDGTVVPCGEGNGCLNEIISNITHDTVLTIEPHLTIFDGYSSIDHSELKNKYTFKNSRLAFEAATNALKKILKENGFCEENEQWIK